MVNHAKRHYKSCLVENAKQLRQSQSPAEQKLWAALRENAKSSGFKFRRQQPIGGYIADFYCASAKCVIEVDGLSHEQKSFSDKLRDDFMDAQGVKVFRFTESDVLRDTESVLRTVFACLEVKTPPLTPPSRGGGLPARLILVGQVIAAHGIKGEVKLKSFTEDPLAIAGYGAVQDDKGGSFSLKIIGAQKDLLIVRIKGVTDRNAAELLAKTKTRFYVTREQLPKLKKGRYYIDDLIGFTAVDAAGNTLATLKDIQNFGAGDILVLQPDAGKEFMLPFKPPFAFTPDMKKRAIEVNVPEGWREEGAALKEPRKNLKQNKTKKSDAGNHEND